MTIVVTGSDGALGSAVCKTLTGAGLQVGALCQQGWPGGAAGIRFAIENVDLADADRANAAFREIHARGGPITGLVNIAGSFIWETITGGRSDAWEMMFRVNLMTALHATQAALPYMQRPSAIVNIGAAAAGRAGAGMGAYATSKSAVIRFTEALAEELRSESIRVNCVSPLTLDTPANLAAMPGTDVSGWVSLEDASDVVLYLLRDAPARFTGVNVEVR